MNILYVYDGDWPQGATRVAKQTRSLAAAGHAVHLLSRNELRKSRVETNEWMTINRLPHVPTRMLNRIINFPYFFNPFWIHAIASIVRRRSIDRILVCDLPLAPTAVWIGKRLKVPVLYDMAEVYPEFLRGLWEYDTMGWTDYVVRNPRAADVLEKYVLHKVDRVFVVSEESASRCRAMGVDPHRVIVVGNTPENVIALDQDCVGPADLADLQGCPVILFVGILIGDRGVGVAIEAMTHVIEAVPRAVLVVVGEGPDRPRLERLVGELQLAGHVRIVGWRNHDELPKYYATSDIGLLPFLNGRHVRITLANKQFDYMAAGLALVASDLPPIRRIIQETGSGVIVPPNDARALAEGVIRLLEDREQRQAMGRSGRRAVLDHYNWQYDEERFLSAFGIEVPPRSRSTRDDKSEANGRSIGS